MLLSSISCKEYEKRDQEWILDRLTLGRRNLLVGKNATGKTRSLNIIGGLARILSGQMPPTLLSANYTACFTDGDKRLTYSFHAEDDLVLSEKFSIDGTTYLDRGEGGVGKIRAAELNKEINFQTPQNELAAVVRRDAIQHPFLQPLYDWGSAVRHYYFGTLLGKDRFAVLVPKGGQGVTDADDKNADLVIGIYRRACEEFGEVAFKGAMLRDLERVDYPADDITVGSPVSIRVRDELSGKLVCLLVKEKGLRAPTDQNTMSQGMFRVLSILTLTNYLTMAKKASCILIDDLGEGLDFDRSCRLIDLLREKTDRSGIQLIASTNDKFVMNRVPLDEWSVLQRRGNRLQVLNWDNSRELFEEFRFIGLSNFSFLEMDFANGVQAEEAAHE